MKNTAYDAAAIAAILQQRCEKLTDIPEKLDFFDTLPDYDPELFVHKKSKSDKDSAREMLQQVIPALEALPAWTGEAIHDCLIGLAEGLGVKNAKLMWPVRIAATGKAVTPGGAVEICAILAGRSASAASGPALQNSAELFRHAGEGHAPLPAPWP